MKARKFRKKQKRTEPIERKRVNGRDAREAEKRNKSESVKERLMTHTIKLGTDTVKDGAVTSPY